MSFLLRGHPPLPRAEIQHGDYNTMSPLYVVTCISNPQRWNSRPQLYFEFAHRMKDAGVTLYTVELAFGERPYTVTDPGNPQHIQLRTTHELWHKENMLNIGISRLPADWQYVAWIDADIGFANPNWANETVHMLQHHKVVQMFSWAQELSANFAPLPNSHHRGFVYGWLQNPGVPPVAGPQGTGTKAKCGYYPYGEVKPGQGGSLYHPGYAWAARREAIDGLGGLIDFAIMGQADYHMAQCLVGNYEGALYPGIHGAYKERVHAWQDRANAVVNRNLGCVEGMVTHYWHGPKTDRKYWDRNRVLIDNAFNPNTDLIYDHRGVLALAGNKPGLRDGLRAYLHSRNEDSLGA